MWIEFLVNFLSTDVYRRRQNPIYCRNRQGSVVDGFLFVARRHVTDDLYLLLITIHLLYKLDLPAESIIWHVLDGTYARIQRAIDAKAMSAKVPDSEICSAST